MGANVYVSKDYAGFSVPMRYAHIARSWEEVYEQSGTLIWIEYSPVFKGSRHYKVSVLVRANSGIHHRSSTRYLTLDNAVRAAIAKARGE
jgi:hypothetical protein